MRDISKLLDIEEPTKIIQNSKNALQTVRENYAIVFDDERFGDDFDAVRDNIKTIIDETGGNVSRLSLIASETEKAADFTALAQLTKVLLDANKQLLEMFELKKRYTKEPKNFSPTDGGHGTITVQNAIFTGSTKDLLKSIRSEMNSIDGE